MEKDDQTRNECMNLLLDFINNKYGTKFTEIAYVDNDFILRDYVIEFQIRMNIWEHQTLVDNAYSIKELVDQHISYMSSLSMEEEREVENAFAKYHNLYVVRDWVNMGESSPHITIQFES